MIDLTPAIVIVAYNRPHSLSRLLDSIEKADYPHNRIPLIISIDYSKNNEHILGIAQDFQWIHGEKKVICHKQNLGLRKHILLCGDLANEFESIIILEDDLYVSPNFYHFTQNALEFSKDKSYISGISLYNHKINVHTGEYFSALEDGFDNWYFQFASSWGQAWSKNQWNEFKEWYQKQENLSPSPQIPKNVTNWSDKSWLKYFIAFLIENNKYFFYPKITYTTNFNDPGTHVASDSTAYQIELFYGKKTKYNFSELHEAAAVYDAFFENSTLGKTFDNKYENLLIDLYGYKPLCNIRYALTSKRLDFKIIKSFSRSLKPIEANIISSILGNELFLYDTSIKTKNDFISLPELNYRRIVYSCKIISHKSATILFFRLTKSRIKSLLNKIFR